MTAEAPPPPAPAPASAPVAKKTPPAKKAAKKASPAPAKSAAPETASSDAPWIEPEGGACPPSHPIKGKLSSKIFHLPGMFAYDRCKADRCYATEDAASSDGLTKAKR